MSRKNEIQTAEQLLGKGQAHDFIKSFGFNPLDIDEAELANAIAKVADNNGLTHSDMHHVFPVILRILRSDSEWANQKDV